MSSLPVRIVGDRVLLRDPLPADALWEFRWGTVETVWQDWDAPWEGAAITSVERFSSGDVMRYLEQAFARMAEPLPTPRASLRVDLIGGPPLGGVSHYHHDSEARLTYAGIDIRESAYWGQGLGTEALGLWIAYLFTHLDLGQIRLGTWSGNTRMIRVAGKCGFELVDRRVGVRQVRGEWYDAMEFSLARERWEGGEDP